MNKYAVFVMVFSAILALGCIQVEQPNKSISQSTTQITTIEQVIKKMKERYDNFQDLYGIINMSVKTGNSTKYEIGKFIVKRPDKFRVESEESLHISNGEVIWLYNKISNEYAVISVPNIGNSETPMSKIGYGFLYDILNDSKKKLVGTVKFKDRECYLIELSATSKNPKILIWVDKQEFYPLKVEISNDQTVVITYEDVKFNTGVSDELFNFIPLKDAKRLKLS